MKHDFDHQALDIAKVKINARSYESDSQLFYLKLSDLAISDVIQARTESLNFLISELTDLVNDKLFNGEYRRQAEIICNFQRKYMSAVIEIYFNERSRGELVKANA